MFSQKCRSRLYKSNFLLRKHPYSCKPSFSLSFCTWRLPNRKSASSPKARLTVRRASSIQKRDRLSKVASPDEKQLRMQIASTSYIESVRLKSRRRGNFKSTDHRAHAPALLIELPSYCVGCVGPHQPTCWVLQFPKFAIQNCNFKKRCWLLAKDIETSIFLLAVKQRTNIKRYEKHEVFCSVLAGCIRMCQTVRMLESGLRLRNKDTHKKIDV